jgi:glucose repression regulatory protein TUP1
LAIIYRDICTIAKRVSRYDRKVQDLQRELESVRGAGPIPPPPHGAPQHNGPPQPAPPTIGHGPRDLFGGIMAGNGAGGPSSLAAPPPMPETAQGMPPQLTQAAGIATAQPGAGHPPYASYNPGSANGEY